jgi:hypothetical protein
LQFSRNRLGIIIIICFLVLILVIYTSTSSPNDYKITAHNVSTSNFEGYGMSFNYPSNWNLTTDGSQGLTILVSPNFQNNEAPSMTISTMQNPQGESYQDAINTVTAPPPDPTYHLISNKTTTVDNITAYINYFTVDDPAHYTQNMTLEYVYMVENGTTYTLIVSAPLNEFNNDQANFNTMINSFKIL